MNFDSTNSIESEHKSASKQSAFAKKLMLITLNILKNLEFSSQPIYLILQLIQSLQVLSIIINGTYYSQWQGEAFSYIKLICSSMSIYPFLKQTQNIHLAILSVFLSLLFVNMIGFLILSKTSSEIRNNSQFKRIIVKFVGFILLLIKTVFQIPLLNVILFGFVSNSEKKTLFFGLTSALVLFYVPFFLYITFIFTDLNPFSKLVFAGETHLIKLSSFLVRLFLVIYQNFDTTFSIQVITLSVFAVYNLAQLSFFLYKKIGKTYSQTITMYKYLENFFFLFTVLFMIICKHNSKNNMQFIYYFLVLVLSPFMISFFRDLAKSSLFFQDFIQLEDTSDIEAHILNLLPLINSLHERSSRALVQGYVSFHARNCNLPENSCTCKEVRNHTNREIEKRKYIYYQFLGNLLHGSINRANSSRRIYILLSLLYQCKLVNRYQAIHSLARTKSNENSLIEEIEYMRIMKQIEMQMEDSQIKKNSSATVDILKFLNFNLKIVQFQQLLNECTKNHIKFWSQLIQVNLNIKKLEESGALIAKQKELVKDFFEQMEDLNGNNSHIMILYGQFLQWVCNQDFQNSNSKLLEKGETILKNIQQSAKINGKNEKYGENSKTLIIIISGNEKQLGTIVQTNNYIKQAIGFDRKQLIGKNINMLMPKVFSQHHNAVLQKFLATSKDRYNGIQRLVPVLASDYYMIPTLAYTKPIPNLEQGIQIVGFLSQYDHIQQDQMVNDKVSYILYECNSQVIMGISKNCHTQFGIPKNLVYGHPENSMNQMKIKHLFGFSIQKSEKGIQNGKQIIVTIDTKLLRDQFVIMNTNSTKKMIDQNLVNEDVKSEVLIRSILQLNYMGIPLRIITVIKDFDQKQAQDRRRSLKFSKQGGKEQKSDSKSESDDLKDLKDFKNFISVKREPNAIRFINLSCMSLIVMFFLGVIGFIILHMKQSEIIQSTMKGIKLAFLNRMYLAELSHDTQKLYLNANMLDSTDTKFRSDLLLTKIQNLINEGKLNQLYLLPVKNFLVVQSPSVKTYVFANDRRTRYVQSSIDEAITVQLVKIQNIVKTPEKYLIDNSTSISSLALKNYYQIQYTQTFVFLSICNYVQRLITIQGIISSDNIKLLLIIQSGVLGLIAIIWIVVSLPKTLQVFDINSKVLSLFNLVSMQDARGVIKRCYVFQSKYLTNSYSDEKKLLDFTIEEEKMKEMETKRKNSLNMPMEACSPANSILETSARVIINPQRKGKEQNMDNLEDLDTQNKMINKGNTEKKKVVLTFCGIFLFLIAFAGLVSIYLIVNYNRIQNKIKMLNTIYNRTSQFEEMKVAFTKSLINPSMNRDNVTISMVCFDLISKIYETERSLVEQLQYSDFNALITTLNTNNLCTLISNYSNNKIWGDENLDKVQCESIDNGVLTRGIKTTLVTIMQQIRSMIQLPQEEKKSLNMTNLIPLTIKNYENLQKYLSRPLLMVSEKIWSSKAQNEKQTNLIFYLISGLFLMVVIVFWAFGWRKYLEYLNESVLRTKSMLNVIPSKIITNNEQLMNEFTSGQLEKVVR